MHYALFSIIKPPAAWKLNHYNQNNAVTACFRRRSIPHSIAVKNYSLTKKLTL